VRRAQDYGTIPKNVFALSAENFRRELRALRRASRYDELAEIAGDAGPSPSPLLRAGFAVGQALRGFVGRANLQGLKQAPGSSSQSAAGMYAVHGVACST
jgi:hypothetical protein